MSMMVIQHNMVAMNGNRMLGITTGKQAKSSEKLSSGYKINRAADDAAGLSISEKMRRQIRGLRQGSFNIQDGISFTQVADGYLHEVHDMLQRANELAVKGANDTLTQDDREYLQQELDQLQKETDRIFKTAEFNEQKIFVMPYVPMPEIPPGTENDFQVFTIGTDSSGNMMYGGIEINDVRHTWEEMGISVADDGKTFLKDQEISFENDYTGERVVINVKKDTQMPALSRNYQWSAGNDGVSVNNVFAATWDEIGIPASGPCDREEYEFTYHGIQIKFQVPPGDDRGDVINAINAHEILGASTSFDIGFSYSVGEPALWDVNPKTEEVTGKNYKYIDNTYHVAVRSVTGSFTKTNEDDDRITVVSTKSASPMSEAIGNGSQHRQMAWNEFSNTGSGNAYPVADWGLIDKDQDGMGSGLITFDDTAVYTYKDTAHADKDMDIEFSYQMSDEASRSEATKALQDASFTNIVYAPGTVNASNAGDATVTISGNYLCGRPTQNTSTFCDTNSSFELQRRYGRWDNSGDTGTLSGSITRTLKYVDMDGNDKTAEGRALTEQLEKSHCFGNDTVWDSGANDIHTGWTDDSGTKEIYVQAEDGLYYKMEVSTQTTRLNKDVIDTSRSMTFDKENGFQGVRFSYSGTFAGYDMISGTGADPMNTTIDGGMFATLVRTESFRAGSSVTRVVSFDGVDTAGQTGLSAAEVAAIPGALTRTLEEMKNQTILTEGETVSVKSEKNISQDSVAVRTNVQHQNNPSLSGEIEEAFTTNWNKAWSDIKDTTSTLLFTASGAATRQFKLNVNNSRNSESHFEDVSVRFQRELLVLASAKKEDTIPLNWSPLNNGIIGFAGVSVETRDQALLGIERVKQSIQRISKERSDFGAQQNRLEHSYNNNMNKEENTTAAESRIRDTDMAKEMVAYSNNNVLAQAGQAMLANANQSKQGILTLLG